MSNRRNGVGDRLRYIRDDLGASDRSVKSRTAMKAIQIELAARRYDIMRSQSLMRTGPISGGLEVLPVSI